MKFTNEFGIKSLSVQAALTTDDYDMSSRPENVVSCTELIDAPKHQILKRRHSKDLVVDISDNFWTMFGSAVHYTLERSNKKQQRLSEERLFIEVGEEFKVHTLAENQRVVDAPWYRTDVPFVTVKYDSYEDENRILEDYKFVSVWEVIFGLKKSRLEQLNIGAFAMNMIGFPVDKVRPVLLLKDWSNKEYLQAEQKAREFGNVCKYPPIPYHEEIHPVWTRETIENFIREKVTAYFAASHLKDDEIAPCNEEERWYSGDVYAVMKEGRKTAVKLFKISDDVTSDQARDAAEALTIELNGSSRGHYVEKRPGMDRRCMEYCPLADRADFKKSICNFARNF